MIEIQQLQIDDRTFRHRAETSDRRIELFLKRLVEDVSERVELEARENAPLGPTGRLKAEGVIRSPVREGVVLDAPAFGGGNVVKGTHGPFMAPSLLSPGSRVFQADVRLNERLKHSIFVHNGTGVYGPRRSPYGPKTKRFMVFYWRGRKWLRKSVKGQKVQPFLTDAYEYVNRVYVPSRMIVLRAEISALT